MLCRGVLSVYAHVAALVSRRSVAWCAAAWGPADANPARSCTLLSCLHTEVSRPARKTFWGAPNQRFHRRLPRLSSTRAMACGQAADAHTCTPVRVALITERGATFTDVRVAQRSTVRWSPAACRARLVVCGCCVVAFCVAAVALCCASKPRRCGRCSGHCGCGPHRFLSRQHAHTLTILHHRTGMCVHVPPARNVQRCPVLVHVCCS